MKKLIYEEFEEIQYLTYHLLGLYNYKENMMVSDLLIHMNISLDNTQVPHTNTKLYKKKSHSIFCFCCDLFCLNYFKENYMMILG